MTNTTCSIDSTAWTSHSAEKSN